MPGISPMRGDRARVPPNVLSIAFGLTGLGEAWNAATRALAIGVIGPNVIFVLAAGAWLVLVAWYASQGPRRLLSDLRDTVQGPFVSIAVIVPMLLAGALASYAFTAGRVLVVIFLALTIALGAFFTGQWIVGDMSPDSAHPGYFVPTVAGGFLGATAAAEVHLRPLAWASFGVGVFCWALLGATILSRLMFRSALPAALVPTLAIEAAPPAVAGIAYFAVTGGATSFIAYALGGYAVFMALVQLRFIPLYVRLRFAPGSWAFTFSYAVVATDALLWVAIARPQARVAYAVLILVLITGLVAAIAARTILAIARGQFLPTGP
jgi:tellurite resistance protein